jgi:hypothetical protein
MAGESLAKEFQWAREWVEGLQAAALEALEEPLKARGAGYAGQEVPVGRRSGINYLMRRVRKLRYAALAPFWGLVR